MAGQFEKAGEVDAYSISQPEDFAEFTSFASPIDLTAQSGYPARPARKVVVVSKGAGTVLQVTTVRGTVRTATIASDGEEFGICAAIGTSTNVSRVRAFW